MALALCHVLARTPHDAGITMMITLGTAIGFVTAGIMSLAFMGFAGLDKFK